MRNWLVLWLFLPLGLLAQLKQLQNITIADGLSQGMIFDLLQDKAGFVWIGTKNGLNRYDGYNFKTFFPDPLHPYALTESQTTALCEDSHGRMWIGTSSKGLCLLDRRTRRFYHADIRTVAGKNAGEKNLNPHINCISEDPNGNFWIGTLDGKIVKLVLPKNLRTGFPTAEDFTASIQLMPVQHLPTEPSGKGAFNIRLSNNRQFFWVLMARGVYKLDYNTGAITPIIAATGYRDITNSFYEENDGSLIIAQKEKVVQWKAPGVVKTIFETDLADGLEGMNIDKQGTVWGVLNNKVYRRHYSEMDQHFLAQDPVSEINKKGQIYCSLVDNQQNVWLGTTGYGIKKWATLPDKFKHVLAGNSIWKVYADRQGRVFEWFFIDAFVLDSIAVQQATPVLPQYHGTAKGGVTEDKNGDFWWLVMQQHLGNNMMLVHLTPDLKTIKEYNLQRPGNYLLTDIVEDHNGILWIGGANAELMSFNPKTEQLAHFDFGHFIPTTEAITGVVRLYIDSEGILWVCTQHGLLKATLANGQLAFTYFKSNPKDPQTLRNDFITAVLDDPMAPTKYLWIATHDGGLTRMDKANYGMRHFTDKDGLLNNNVVGILSDSMKNIWISTYRGISELNPKSLIFSHYSEKDGLQSDEFNTSVFCKGSNGALIFGGINGLSIFKPAPDWNNKIPAQVKIVGLKINNELVEPGDSSGLLAQAIEYLPKLSPIVLAKPTHL